MYMTYLLFVVSAIASYLIGSLCSAIIVSKVFDLPDPRTEGSKNPGATNVLRLSGKKYALIVLLTDLIKGVIPTAIAKTLLGLSADASAVVGLFAIIGHMYPYFFDFKGGKGVATTLGVLLGLHVFLGVSVIIVWITTAYWTKYSSLASLVAVITAPFLCLFSFGDTQGFVPIIIITMLVIFQHRENITRLMDGTESKIK